MLKHIKKSFALTNKYIILATPLILFSLFSSLYILFSSRGNLINLLIAACLFILMLTAFLAGWSYMLKLCVTKEETNEDANLLIKEFPAGVGEYFLPVLGLLFNVFIVSGIIFALFHFIGMKFIGNPNISVQDLSQALTSIESTAKFLESLSPEQLTRLYAWNIIIAAGLGIEYFLLLFCLPALSFKSHNPFKAFLLSIKDLFSKSFFKNVLLYLILFISYVILSFLTSLFGLNVVTHFIFTLVNFYYLVYIAVLVYAYYYDNFIRVGGKFDERV